jgi:ATP-binding cassette subfamily B protein
MSILRTYARVLRAMARDRRVMVCLVAGNLAAACLQFLDPLLFGRVIGLLGQSDTIPRDALMSRGGVLIGLWAAIGAAGILTNLATALGAERLAHRTRLRCPAPSMRRPIPAS